MGLSERDKQALKLVARWRRKLEELGLNENNSIQSQIAKPFPDNFSQNQYRTETSQTSLNSHRWDKIKDFWGAPYSPISWHKHTKEKKKEPKNCHYSLPRPEP